MKHGRRRQRMIASCGMAPCAVILLGAPGLAAQREPGPIPPPPGHPIPKAETREDKGKATNPVIKVETTLVNLDVLATDEDGLVLAGLKRENFRVYDEGKVQTIAHFETTGAPITIVMLLEYSGAAYDYFAYKGASWGATLLDHLEAKDYLALVTYDIKPTVRVDFTRNRAAVQEALSTLSYPQFHEANLFDALVDTLDRLTHVKGKTAILIVGTGANTMSQNTLDDTIRRVKSSDVTIFSVGVAEAEYQSSVNSSLSYLQARNQLQNFAKMTGGMSWFPRFEGEVPDVFRSVSTFLRGQYRIGFSPANLPHDGKYHKLKVEIVGSDGSPLIVTNPKGKKRKTEVYTREGYTAPKGSPAR